MKKTRRIGLFFGSFNPVHNGHLMIGNYMAEYHDFDQVWFVISPLNPFKRQSDLLPDFQRRELLVRAVGDYPAFRVSSVEFKLPKPSYTIDTLDFLSEKHPDFEFSVIMGSDQMAHFEQWKEPQRILSGYSVLVYPRPSGRRELSGSLLNHPSVTLVDAPMMEISSSFIREAIKEGRDVRFYVPAAVWEYIDEMHFYK